MFDCIISQQGINTLLSSDVMIRHVQDIVLIDENYFIWS